jgi:hypothetical protein
MLNMLSKMWSILFLIFCILKGVNSSTRWVIKNTEIDDDALFIYHKFTDSTPEFAKF